MYFQVKNIFKKQHALQNQINYYNLFEIVIKIIFQIYIFAWKCIMVIFYFLIILCIKS